MKRGYSIASCRHNNKGGKKLYHIKYKSREFIKDMINPHYENVTVFSVVCGKCLGWYKKNYNAKVIEILK